MAKPCSICSHPQRELIDKLLVNGSTLKEIEDSYGLSKSAISRHRAEHISITSPAVAMKPEIIADSDNLISQLEMLHQRTLNVLSTAEESGRDETALRAIGQATKNLELMAKISIVLADRLKEAKAEGEPGCGIFIYGEEDVAQNIGKLDVLISDYIRRLEAGEKIDIWGHSTASKFCYLLALVQGASVILPSNGRNPDIALGRVDPGEIAGKVVAQHDTYKPESTLSPDSETTSLNSDLTKQINQNKPANTVHAPEARPECNNFTPVDTPSTPPEAKDDGDFLAELRRRRMQHG